MFPFYVFEHWWGLLAEENRDARRTYEAPKEFNEFLAFLHIFLPYRAVEGVLRALERLKIVPTSLDYSTIWERVRNMNTKFPEANDRLEVIADATGISANKGGQYIIAKWGKNQGLKIPLRQLRIYEIRERRSRGFTEIKLMTPMRFTGLGLRSSSRLKEHSY